MRHAESCDVNPLSELSVCLGCIAPPAPIAIVRCRGICPSVFEKERPKSVKGTRQDMSTAFMEVGQLMLFTLRVILSSMYEGPAEI